MLFSNKENNSYESNRLMHTIKDGTLIEFEKTKYIFTRDYASQKTYFISNHGFYEPKSCCFIIENKNDIVIDGHGCEISTVGMMIPFVLDGCKNITIKNLSITFENPLMVQAEIISSGKDFAELRIFGADRCIIENGSMFFENGSSLSQVQYWGAVSLDAETKEYLTGEEIFGKSLYDCKFIKLSENKFRINGISKSPKIGSIVLFRGGDRYAPAIFMNNSKNLILENVVCKNAVGMGLIAQKCENITLNKFLVKPDNQKYYSANYDAVHFVCCTGEIGLSECEFSNQLDDGLNIQGIYTSVAQVSKNRIILRYNHPQQLGIQIHDVGDKIRFLNRETLIPYAYASVLQVNHLNISTSELILDCDLSDKIKIGDVCEDMSKIANLTVTKCRFENNRARGMLIGGGGRTVIKDNYFHNSGSAVYFECDAEYWYESGACSDVLIENNIFDNCGYIADWGGGYVINVMPQKAQDKSHCYHHSISICNNTFLVKNQGLLSAVSVEKLSFCNNTIKSTDGLECDRKNDFDIYIRHCDDLNIKNNQSFKELIENIKQEVNLL